MIHVMVVGQVPPPHVGQFIMIEQMLNGHYKNVCFHHVRMSFSGHVEEIGRFQIAKIWHLFLLICRIWVGRFKWKTNVLYYPPAGPNKVPMYRDIVILLFTRWLFKKVVFHFHAGGISELYPSLPLPMRWLFRLAYHGADVGIRLAVENPDDSHLLNIKEDRVIPYGIFDANDLTSKGSINDYTPTVLFVGMLRESKGLFIFLEACRLLSMNQLDFRAKLVGAFDSNETEARAKAFVSNNHLDEKVVFTGVLIGDEKWQAYSTANIFCFPTFYEAETFGLVVLEAMQFSLPVVATNWRGVSSIILDGETGFLVSTHDSQMVADRLLFLLENPEKAREMGENGRKRYLSDYTVDKFWANIESLFADIAL